MGWALAALCLASCGGSGSEGNGGMDAGLHDAHVEHSAADRREAAPMDKDGGRDAPFDAGNDSGIDAAEDSGRDAGGDGRIPALTCYGDAWEPNDGEVIATPLPSIDDCDGSGSFLSAVSSGMGDVDWLHFFGTDTTGCSVDPTVEVDAPGLRLCAYIICPEGITTITGCTHGSPDSSLADTPGCCTTGTKAMTVQMNCGGIDDSADVYIRIDQPDSDMCIPYDVSYHF